MNTEKILTTLRSQLDYFVDRALKEKNDYASQCAFYHSAFGAVLYAQRLAVSDSNFDFAQTIGKLWMDEYRPTFEIMGVA